MSKKRPSSTSCSWETRAFAVPCSTLVIHVARSTTDRASVESVASQPAWSKPATWWALPRALPKHQRRRMWTARTRTVASSWSGTRSSPRLTWSSALAVTASFSPVRASSSDPVRRLSRSTVTCLVSSVPSASPATQKTCSSCLKAMKSRCYSGTGSSAPSDTISFQNRSRVACLRSLAPMPQRLPIVATSLTASRVRAAPWKMLARRSRRSRSMRLWSVEVEARSFAIWSSLWITTWSRPSREMASSFRRQQVTLFEYRIPSHSWF